MNRTNSEHDCVWCKTIIGRTDVEVTDECGGRWHRECFDFVKALNEEEAFRE